MLAAGFCLGHYLFFSFCGWKKQEDSCVSRKCLELANNCEMWNKKEWSIRCMSVLRVLPRDRCCLHSASCDFLSYDTEYLCSKKHSFTLSETNGITITRSLKAWGKAKWRFEFNPCSCGATGPIYEPSARNLVRNSNHLHLKALRGFAFCVTFQKSDNRYCTWLRDWQVRLAELTRRSRSRDCWMKSANWSVNCVVSQLDQQRSCAFPGSSKKPTAESRLNTKACFT